MRELCSIGRAKLVVIGLNPQRIGTESEALIPSQAAWGGMDYQASGLGEARTRFEAVTYPHVTGGLDALEWLQRHHEGEEAVNYIRLYGSYLGRMLGQVRIRHIYVDETRLHPRDGVGRRVDVQLDLVYVGGRVPGGK